MLALAGGLSNRELAQTFAAWNETDELKSYLTEITATIFATPDALGEEGAHVVDAVLDKVGMKGTGRWTLQEAAERSVPAPTMSAALDARYVERALLLLLLLVLRPLSATATPALL